MARTGAPATHARSDGCFPEPFSAVDIHFCSRRHLLSADAYCQLRPGRLQQWREARSCRLSQPLASLPHAQTSYLHRSLVKVTTPSGHSYTRIQAVDRLERSFPGAALWLPDPLSALICKRGGIHEEW